MAAEAPPCKDCGGPTCAWERSDGSGVLAYYCPQCKVFWPVRRSPPPAPPPELVCAECRGKVEVRLCDDRMFRFVCPACGVRKGDQITEDAG